MRYALFALLLIFGALQYFGVTDFFGASKVDQNEEATITEEENCPAYPLVRRLEADGVITEYRPIKSPEAWDCQYVVNDGLAAIRARVSNEAKELSYFAEDTTLEASRLFDDLDAALKSYGFKGY